MQYRNTHHRFGVISITFHWLGALGITVMLSAALMMASAHDDHTYVGWMKFHSSVGVLVLPLLVARIIWHFTTRQPAKLSDNRTLNRFADLVHRALLMLILIQLATGLLGEWSGGLPIRVLEWFPLSSSTSAAVKAGRDALGDIHRCGGLTIAILAAVHLMGVFKNLVVDGDDTLARMIGILSQPAGQPPSGDG